MALSVIAIVTVTALASTWTATTTLLLLFFLFIDPALYADDSVDGGCLGKAIVNGHSKRLKWHRTLTI